MEFDLVIVPDADTYSGSEEDRRLLYVVCTRALHELMLYSQKEGDFISSINSELWELNKTVKFNGVEQKTRNLILTTLQEVIGSVPKKFVDYLNRMDNLGELLKLFGELNSINDIDKIYEFMNGKIILVDEETQIKNKFRKEESINKLQDNLEKEHIKELNKKQIIDQIKIRYSKLSPNEAVVAKYIMDNIDEIHKFKTSKELSNKIGVNPTIILDTIARLGLGSYSTFINKVNLNQ